MARILHISTRLILGGSQENTVLSCEGQSRLGHQVHLAFGPIYGPEGSLLDRVTAFRASPSSPHGITTHVIPDMIREVAPRRDVRAFHQLSQLIRDVRPDVVHTHSSKAGILGRIAAWRLLEQFPAMRVVHTIHGPPFLPVEGSLSQRAKLLAANAAYTLAERVAALHCHTIVSVADAMTAQFLDRHIGDPAQFVTVRSGMELDPYLRPAPGEDRTAARTALGFAPTDFVIGTVARLAQHKGHDDIIDALAEPLRQHPHWKLLWVGDGWWRERLEAKLAARGLRSRVVLTGLVPPQRVPACIRAMDVLVHPSYREGLPRTVPQALLANVLPIAYDANGTREVCREMQTGRLVPVGDLARLRNAVCWAYDHPQERAAMTERGHRFCVREFGADTMVARLERIYFPRS